MRKFFSKIYSYITTNHDKVLHFIAGVLIAEICFTLGLFFQSWAWNYVLSNVITVSILAFKEVYDKLHPKYHSAEIMDFMAGFVGLIFINLQFSIIYLLK